MSVKLCRPVLLVAALLLGACHQPAPPLGDFSFVKHAGHSRLIGITSAARAAGVRTANGAHGTDIFGVSSTPAPVGARTQVMRFRFRSRGFFSHAPAAHITIGLTGAWRKDDPATTRQEGLLVGRGLIIGTVSAAAHGCQQASVAEIEGYYRHANRLYPSSCSPSLAEDTWYQFTLMADSNQRVGYVLRDARGHVLARHMVQDVGNRVPANLGGWWISHVFSNTNPKADWAIDFASVHVHWLTEPASEALLKRL